LSRELPRDFTPSTTLRVVCSRVFVLADL
jgi:hypothetical protein